MPNYMMVVLAAALIACVAGSAYIWLEFPKLSKQNNAGGDAMSGPYPTQSGDRKGNEFGEAGSGVYGGDAGGD